MATKVRMPAPTIDWRMVQEKFQCSELLWQGLWKEVGDIVGRSWDVWLATYIALGATAGRSLWWYYYRAPVYGMAYGLVVAPTGAGKEFCLNVTSALLPESYKTRDSVQSGQGLFPLLCDVAEKRTIKTATPLVLMLSEWNKLVHMGGIQHSTLIDDLNALFHRARGWNLSRSDRGGAGGDRQMKPPVLSILGTTTPEGLVTDVDNGLVNRGFLNRYLLLPGPVHAWQFWPSQSKTADPVVALAGVRAKINALSGYRWGGGRDYQEAFTDEAAELLVDWGEQFFGPLMREVGAHANRKKRLHVYAHQIALLGAWSKKAPFVEADDVLMAITAVEASAQFIDFLWRDETIPLTTVEEGDFMVEQAVIDRVVKKPDYFDKRRLWNALKHQGIPFAKISKVLDQLNKAGMLLINPNSMRYVLKENAPLDKHVRTGDWLMKQGQASSEESEEQ